MRTTLTRRRLLGVGGTALALTLAGCSGAPKADQWAIDGTLSVSNAQQFSSPGCSCCGEYAAYLEAYLNTPITQTYSEDIVELKRRYGVPSALQSCHTLVLDGYVVEGHIPASVIATLLEDTPAIDGIALPGMPAGSPGMGGEKNEPFTVYVLGGEKTGDVFTEL